MAQEKLDELKAAPNVRKQKHSNILHVYECPRGRGWHVGHDYEVVEANT